MENILRPLQNLAEMEAICRQAKNNRWNTGDQWLYGKSQKAHFIYGLSGLFPSHLIWQKMRKLQKELYEDYVL